MSPSQPRVDPEALLGTVEQAVIATALDGTITYWNRFAERLYGWTAEEVLGRNIQDVTPGQMSREQAEAIMTQLRKGESWAGEFMVQRRDGTTFLAMVTDTPMRDPDGQLVGIVGLSSDVSERKRMEQALAAALDREQAASVQAAESLALLDLLVSTAPVGIVFLDRDLRYVRINQELATMNGLPIEAHIGRSIHEVVPHFAAKATPWLRHVLETGEAVRDRVLTGETLKGAGQQQIWRTSFYPLRAAGGDVVGVGAIAIDVTNQQLLAKERERLLANERAARAEAELQGQRLRQTLEVLPEAVIIAENATQTFVMSNAVSQMLIGIDLQGRTVPFGPEPVVDSRRLDGGAIAADDLPLQRAMRGEAVTGAQLILRHVLDDRDVPLLVNSAPLRDSNGCVVGAVCIFQDITPIRELDQQKDEFLATVSHDLQQPLAVIKGRAQLLRRRLARGETPDAGRVTDTLATIEATVGDMAGQVAELLDATRLHMGRPLELEYASTDLVSFLHQVVADWAGTSPRHDISLVTELTSLNVVVDAARLRRAIANLLSNAIKYSPAGGAVRLGLEREGPPASDCAYAVISVSDSGVGIPAADVPRIFERYYRAGNASRAAAGTGLGLAGARQIVIQHGGTISVTSTEGEGSTFIVRLPI